jgi:hypothetical protein
MLHTKNLVTSISEIPVTWIYEFYLKLSETLTGQDVNMKSVFNLSDKKPSMYVFMSSTENCYFWKDFSTSRGGDAVDLVYQLKNLVHRSEAIHLIINDYMTYLNSGKGTHLSTTLDAPDRYKLIDYKTKQWSEQDRLFWASFGIPLKLLYKYNVKPIRSYTIKKDTHGVATVIRNLHMYGYFTKKEELYKIYQPLKKDYKFFRVMEYIQGYDQLTFDKDFLVIVSSLKDLMALDALGFSNAESVAVDNESVLLSSIFLRNNFKKYKGMCTLFDNDQGGMAGMLNHYDAYGLPYVHFPYENDLADCNKEHGIISTRTLLQPLLSKTLHESINILKTCKLNLLQ